MFTLIQKYIGRIDVEGEFKDVTVTKVRKILIYRTLGRRIKERAENDSW